MPKRSVEEQELAERWGLDPEELSWVSNKYAPTRLGFAAQLKLYRLEGRFPNRHRDVPEAAISVLAQQTETTVDRWLRYDLQGRGAKYHRTQIRLLLDMRPSTEEDGQRLLAYLSNEVQLAGRPLEAVKQDARHWYRRESLEPPSPKSLDRLVRSALAAQEMRQCTTVAASLPDQTRESLEALLMPSAAPQGGSVIQVLAHGPGAARREIQEGLNVVESWNKVNDFILFGNGSEFATNRHEDQEVTMLALHLLQVSLVYINTLMMQDILDEPEWLQRLTDRDLRALTPLAYGHVTPYGNFALDLNDRLSIVGSAARTETESHVFLET